MKRNGNYFMNGLTITTLLLMVTFLSACGGKSETTDAGQAPEAVTETTAVVSTTTAAQETTAAVSETKENKELVPEKESASARGEISNIEEALLGGSNSTKKEYTGPIEGTYTAFGALSEGHAFYAESLELTSELMLEKDGTGYMTLNGDKTTVKKWTRDGEKLQVTVDDGGTADCIIRDGIIELEIPDTGGDVLYFAKEDADTSSYELMTMEEYTEKVNNGELDLPNSGNDSHTADLWNRLDKADGIYLQYDVYLEAQDVTQEYEVQVLDGQYHSLRTMKVKSRTDRMITYYSDDKVYNLYPDDMTGIMVTDVSSSFIRNDPELLDDLINDIYVCSQRTNYSKDTMEHNGVTYDAEIFPAEGYEPECIFLYDKDGHLAKCLRAENPDSDTPGATDAVYTIHEFDDRPDSKVFDISAYTIKN